VRIEKLRAAWDIDAKFVHYPLHPETPPEGMTLEQLFAGRNIDIAAAQDRMQGLMNDEGLPYGARTMTYNSRLAQELASYAQTQPGGEQIHDRLFQAYFVEGINIAVIDNLVRIATSIGLATEACREVLIARRFRDAVDADWNRARTLGLTGVPAFVVGQTGVVGAQPYEVLEQLLEQTGAKRRDSARCTD
jgi:predicted DsbA family dithiol-disulfide isomerase